MKTYLSLVVVSALLTAHADIVMQKSGPSFANPLNQDISLPTPPRIITDTYRVINGYTQQVDKTWLAVSGIIAQVHPDEGLRVNGFIEGYPMQTDFFVVNLPVSGAEGDSIPPVGVVLLVKPAGTYTYKTAAGSSRTIRKFDYGQPWTPPPAAPLTKEQIAALRAKSEATKLKGKAAALKFNQDAADKGDAYGLFRMGERYRDGDGVETNLLKARTFLTQAADAGNSQASNALAHLIVPIKK